MHYPPYAFTKRCSGGYSVGPTIVPKLSGAQIGQRDGLSQASPLSIFLYVHVNVNTRQTKVFTIVGALLLSLLIYGTNPCPFSNPLSSMFSPIQVILFFFSLFQHLKQIDCNRKILGFLQVVCCTHILYGYYMIFLYFH